MPASSPTHLQSLPYAEKLLGRLRLRSAVARYALAISAVVAALALRILLTPLTGRGAPFVVFFGAILITSLLAGAGPAALVAALALPISLRLFVFREGWQLHQVLSQSLLYCVDASIIIVLTTLVRRWEGRAQAANRQLREASAEREAALARTRETIELSPDAYFLADLTATFIDVNRTACRLLGYDRDELVGMTIVDIIRPEDVRRLESERAELLVPGTALTNEWELKKKDGSFVPVEVSANILEQGRWQAFVRDITERKRADEALRLSEAKFSGIVSIAADAIISVDEQQRITIFNEGASRIFGYSRDEVLGTPLERLIPERFRDAHRAHFARFAAGSETVRKMGERQNIFGLRKSGEEFPAEVSMSRVGVDGGRLFCVVLRDITDRKRVEESLRRAASDLRTAQRVAHVGSFRWDVRRGEVERSEELTRILGVDPALPLRESLLGPESKILTEESKALLRAAIQRTQSDGSPYEVDLQFTRPDGSGGWVVARGEAVRDENGDIIGITGTAADVTTVKELQRLRDEWTSVIAHDLRQPIGTILMASDFLPTVHGPELSEKERALTERIHSAARSLQRMVGDLLDMSLLEAHRLQLERKWTNPDDLVRETLERLAHLPGIDRVHVQAEPDLPRVCVDPMRIGQVLSNLVSNAIKYGDEQSDIIVELKRRAGEIIIAVTNHGPGIPPDELPRLFNRFARSRTTRGAGVPGLGLGLYIAKGVIQAHGGRLTADSVLGKTTTFRIALTVSPRQREAA